jgi:uncharacterized repeat protein (TIGR02543 family)
LFHKNFAPQQTATKTFETQTLAATPTSALKTVVVTTTGGTVTCTYPAASPTNTITIPPETANYEFTVKPGTKIQFTANPAPGYKFAGWTGDLKTDTNPKTVEVGSGKTVTATFILLLPVPEYSIGGLMALAACFAAFIAFKKPSIKRK